jgi:hypothetical protein
MDRTAARNPSGVVYPLPVSQDTTSVSGGERPKRVRPHVLAAAYVVLVACLVTLRATISRLGFLSFGWILVIAVVPLLPWLLPMLAPLLQRVAPSVQSVKLGMLQIDLRQAQPVVAGLGVAAQTLAAAQPAPAPDFASTNAMDIIAGMAAVHEKGAGLVIVDLQDGAKWWLPNLYFLSRVLESDPFVHHLVFTEARGGTDGFFVGVCTPSDVRLRVEAALPVYATAGQQIAIPKDMSAPGADAQLANQFNALRVALTPPGSSVADEVHRPVTGGVPVPL